MDGIPVATGCGVRLALHRGFNEHGGVEQNRARVLKRLGSLVRESRAPQKREHGVVLGVGRAVLDRASLGTGHKHAPAHRHRRELAARPQRHFVERVERKLHRAARQRARGLEPRLGGEHGGLGLVGNAHGDAALVRGDVAVERARVVGELAANEKGRLDFAPRRPVAPQLRHARHALARGRDFNRRARAARRHHVARRGRLRVVEQRVAVRQVHEPQQVAALELGGEERFNERPPTQHRGNVQRRRRARLQRELVRAPDGRVEREHVAQSNLDRRRLGRVVQRPHLAVETAHRRGHLRGLHQRSARQRGLVAEHHVQRNAAVLHTQHHVRRRLRARGGLKHQLGGVRARVRGRIDAHAGGKQPRKRVGHQTLTRHDELGAQRDGEPLGRALGQRRSAAIIG